MADLYSKSKLREAASTFENMDLSAEIEILQQLSRDFQAKSTENETQYEQIFNDLFFGQLLGYENGKHRIPQAGTPIGGKRADLALGFFEDNKYIFEGVQVIVELKGSNVSLDHKQYGHGGQTPVDQGFGYKTAFKDCPWLIVSNFASIRLYRDNKQDFQGWTLEQLLDPENQYFHLRSLLGLLKRNYLIGERGTIARSEQYLSEFRIQQEKISKAFYKEYKSLRFELINDIKYHNPTLDVETLVSKAQKIIDRIIFIHFCEDYGLLPEGKLLEVIEHNKSLINISIWQILTGFFEAVNTGSSKLGIPNGYNGGLFAKDQVLDALKVGDTICKKFVEIGKYDFAEELSVNVLGHIFEQSISDIEQLKIDLLGETLETEQLVEKKTSKRKKDGIFYTPEYIVDYIVQNSLGKYLSEKEESCLHKHRNKKNGEQLAYQEYQQILQQVKVLDPACGSGAFLVRVFDYLLDENIRVGEKTGTLFDNAAIYKSILENNLYGVDLNPESVEITKLSLWLKTAEKDKKLNNLDKNIKCGNSLIDDESVVGESAFDWQKEFPEIFAEGGFDVIVGNPPYVNIEKLETNEVGYLFSKYETCQGRTDLYIPFIESNLKKLKKGGILGYIIPYSVTNQKYGQRIREKIINTYSLLEIFDLSKYMVFLDATVKTVILIIGNSKSQKTLISSVNNKEEFIGGIVDSFSVDQNMFLTLKDSRFETRNVFMYEKLKKKILNDTTQLKNICFIAYGSRLNHKTKKIGKDFYISEVRKDGYKPFLEGKDIERYTLKQSGWLNYKPKEHYNSMFKQLFETEKIMFINVVKEKLRFAFDDKGLYNSHTVINCIKYDLLESVNYKPLQKNIKDVGGIKIATKFQTKFLLALLNSTLISWYFHVFLSEGLHFYPNDAKELPIKNISLAQQQPFIEKAEKMLALNAELSEKSDLFLRLLSSKYRLESLPQKIQKFRELDFAELLKTLKLSKMPLAEQADLMQYFEQNKSSILALQSQIDQTDREIDEMVFDLYGLNEEERSVVMRS